MAATDRDLREIVDLLAVNVTDEILPQLGRMESTLADHGRILMYHSSRFTEIEQRLAVAGQVLGTHTQRLDALVTSVDALTKVTGNVVDMLMELNGDVRRIKGHLEIP